MKSIPEPYRIPLQWEIPCFRETFTSLKKTYKRFKQRNGNRDIFDLDPHITTIQEKMVLEKRYRHVGFPVNVFLIELEDLISVIEQADAEKITAYRKDLIEIATWFYYNPPLEQQKPIMTAS